MPKFITVGIKDLKNNLSAYLREVRRGVRVLVCDRDTVVAELHEPLSHLPSQLSVHPLLSEWITAGVVTLPSAARKALPASPIRLREGTALELLDQERGESGP